MILSTIHIVCRNCILLLLFRTVHHFDLCVGLAMMGSTCATKFGRTVNNDIGLASAIIIAHEAAHT